MSFDTISTVIPRAALLVLLAALSACRSAPPDASLPAATLPVLSNMEAPVQQQILAQFESVTKLAREHAAPEVLAAAYGTLGSLLFAANRDDTAETAYLHAQALAPGDGRWPYYLGHVYMNRPDRPKAIAAFERTLQLSPGDVAALVWLGRVYLDDNQPAQADARYAQALAAQPGTVAALYGLGQAALAQRDYSRAVERFEQVLAADPRASIAHYPLALAYRGLGDTANAEAHLRQQGKTEVGPPDPRMVELRNLLDSSAAEEARGMRAAEGGDYRAAVEHFRKGVGTDTNTVAGSIALGRVLAEQRMTQEALKLFLDAAARDTSSGEALYHAAETIAAEGDLKQATIYLQQSLERDPVNAASLYQLARLQTYQGDRKTASATLEKLATCASTEIAVTALRDPLFTEDAPGAPLAKGMQALYELVRKNIPAGQALVVGPPPEKPGPPPPAQPPSGKP